jgi:pimeloyl-ACP methyl ester carboxylesterase
VDHLELVVEDPDHGRLRFDGCTAGPVDGPLVLLLHGCPQTSVEWRTVQPALAAVGYRAVAVDQRGYSSGARPEGVEAYAISRLCDDALAFADQLGADRFHLVGHDYGAVLTWQLAARRPDRLLSATALSVPHPVAYLEAYALGDQEERSTYFSAFRDGTMEQAWGADGGAGLRATYEVLGFGPEETAAYVSRLGSVEALRCVFHWYRAAGVDLITDLPPVTVPMLLVFGTDDPALSVEGAWRTAAHVAGPYTYVQLPGAGHWLPETAPDAVLRALVPHLAAVPT